MLTRVVHSGKAVKHIINKWTQGSFRTLLLYLKIFIALWVYVWRPLLLAESIFTFSFFAFPHLLSTSLQLRYKSVCSHIVRLILYTKYQMKCQPRGDYIFWSANGRIVFVCACGRTHHRCVRACVCAWVRVRVGAYSDGLTSLVSFNQNKPGRVDPEGEVTSWSVNRNATQNTNH